MRECFQSFWRTMGKRLRRYADYSAFFIKHYSPSFFLSLIKAAQRLPGLPSWAADWTVSWPNNKAAVGKGFAAAPRIADDKDSGAVFMRDGGLRILTLVRPRILRGCFTRDGLF